MAEYRREGSFLAGGILAMASLVTCLTTGPEALSQELPPRFSRPGLDGQIHESEPHDSLRFSGAGHTFQGDWKVTGSLSRRDWRPGDDLSVQVSLQVDPGYLAAMEKAKLPVSQFVLLVTAERTFDATGWMRLPSDERMSTLLTPAGLAIEGGIQGAVTTRYGYPFKTPLDEYLTTAVPTATRSSQGPVVRFTATPRLPADLPPGIYRLRFDLGVKSGTRVLNLNGFGFASRPFSDQAGTICYFYSPPIPAGGRDVAGLPVDGARIQPRAAWTLLSRYNSNGYAGVVADEDRGRFALSGRSIIQDEVILPLSDDNGARLSYSLEPTFPADAIDPYVNVPWNWQSGELTVDVTGPDGVTLHLGTKPFVEKGGYGPTTKSPAFTAWKPSAYGRHTVVARGWIADQWGNRVEGGGTYRFWIAKRMTMATATFQGMPYPVGTKYGRDIAFSPPVPAQVEVTATLYPSSDVALAKSLSYSGSANAAGVFGAAQGMQSFVLDAPGEYHASILARYTDRSGHLWVCAMRHAGVVYPEDSTVIAHGKKILIDGKFVDRGETKFEGYVDPDGTNHLAHITAPYNAGDVILIAAEGQGANKIEPVFTYQRKGQDLPWDPKLNGVGVTNLFIRTSNGYSPHLFPEFITDMEYYYGAAPRPGFMSRFVVGESNVRAPYWPTSPNAFGGQIGASPNGDTPGDIYRLLGSVVLRDKGSAPAYAGYIGSAFILPKGTVNNRVVAPGAEDLIGSDGSRARFFLVGLRPGMAYEVGATFAPALQIDPILPVSIHFVLTYPDGRTKTADGVGDRFGSFVGAERWPLDVAGVYRYTVEGSWDSHVGRMPGLPATGGEFYVYRKERPTGAAGLNLDLPVQSPFSPIAGLKIAGTSSAKVVRYALLTPGAVIEQGEIPVDSGRFSYQFDPGAVHARIPIYDVVSVTTGKPQIGRVIHLTFFSEESGPDGTKFFDFARVILRGTEAVWTR